MPPPGTIIAVRKAPHVSRPQEAHSLTIRKEEYIYIQFTLIQKNAKYKYSRIGIELLSAEQDSKS